MKYHQKLPCFAVIFTLFFINAAYSETDTARNDDDSKTVYIEKKRFTLKCLNPGTDKVIWEKDGKNITTQDKGVKFTVSGKDYLLWMEGANDRNVGNYSCTPVDKESNPILTKKQTFTVGVKVLIKVEHDNINVVEGEPLKIVCQSLGSPRIYWKYKNESGYNETFYESTDRVTLKPGGDNNVTNAIFILNETHLYDRGEYTCIGQSTVDSTNEVTSMCMVRVKDRYAALWPFLGICAEVFVLCLIIFIYEKKRNKTELEESDTDQSPDQKNTPDHGKDSNLRHRQ